MIKFIAFIVYCILFKLLVRNLSNIVLTLFNIAFIASLVWFFLHCLNNEIVFEFNLKSLFEFFGHYYNFMLDKFNSASFVLLKTTIINLITTAKSLSAQLNK